MNRVYPSVFRLERTDGGGLPFEPVERFRQMHWFSDPLYWGATTGPIFVLMRSIVKYALIREVRLA